MVRLIVPILCNGVNAPPGKVPTIGRLVALNREEVVVETQGSAGRVAVHFPRLNFSVRAAPTVSSKL